MIQNRKNKMGSSYGIRCTKCDYEKQFKIGIGMMYSPDNLQDIDSEFSIFPSLIKSKKTLNLVRALLNEKNGRILGDCGHEIFVCPKCGEFYERFAYKVKYDGGVFVPEYKCNKCKAVLCEAADVKKDAEGHRKGIDLSEFHCPKCGKKSLIEDFSYVIMWD
ncbi:hypothetical protein [Clostridium sp.]|uniref:hypothetical protein n=1 Tax=Clostridium sp. TaxID=1506 RepID=UPI003D6D83B9